MLYEDDMHYLPDNIVPCRGRAGQADTNLFEAFTAEALDALAPLEPGDQKEIVEYGTPDRETIERMEKRIRAARRLKYGR